MATRDTVYPATAFFGVLARLLDASAILFELELHVGDVGPREKPAGLGALQELKDLGNRRANGEQPIHRFLDPSHTCSPPVPGEC